MRTLSATCVAIASAYKAGTLKLIERNSRFGDTFVAIEDHCGIIEAQDDMSAANARVAAILERLA